MSGRDFSQVRRLVVKVGTNTLSHHGSIDGKYIKELARQIALIRESGVEVLLVTSGAIGMGAGEMGYKEKIASIPKRQAFAAIGQPLLMHEYKRAFEDSGIPIAQVLLTSDVLSHRGTYLNLRNSVETLLSMGVLPIFNENDNISTAEIGNAFGDNDRLSALVASKVDADLLVILTDIDAFYDGNPRENPQAKPIREVSGISAELLSMAGSRGQGFSTGGMRTKLEAVRIAEGAGAQVVLVHGRHEDILQKVMEGQEVGTLFLSGKKLRNRTRWILHADPQGKITVDAGAEKALEERNSLLPRGLVKVSGEFASGSVVIVNDRFKLLSKFSSEELRQIQGLSSGEMEAKLGKKDVIARPEDVVQLEEMERDV